jgi:gliding motility-associated-like protein
LNETIRQLSSLKESSKKKRTLAYLNHSAIMRCWLVSIFVFVFSFSQAIAQCGPTTPTFTVDLTGNPSGTYISPTVVRNDNCCGTTAPDKCVKFIITLDPAAAGINFSIASGAIPPGALFYQIGCGPQVQVGSAICLSGPGPHVLTFCKPGNNSNTYQITSIPAAVAGTDIVINDGCIGQIVASGFNVSTVSWTSVFPGTVGAFNNYLSCLSGCINPTVASVGTPPAFVDFRVCGTPQANCVSTQVCDTIRVTFNPTLNVNIIPQNPTICFGQLGTTLTANGTGGTPPYSYVWNNLTTAQTLNNIGVGNYTVQLLDASGCPPTSASVTVTSFSSSITANAGPDKTVCIQFPTAIISGTVTGVSTGIWTGGGGTFNPNNTTLTNLSYSPTSAELAAGFVDLTLTTTNNGTCPAAIDEVRIFFSPFTGTISTTPAAVSCFGGNNGSAIANVLGGADPFSYFWNTSPSQTNDTAVNLTQGTYSVTVTDANGCTAASSVVVTQPPVLAFSSSQTNVSCAGGNNGSVTITPTGGTAPYSYNWLPGGETTASIQNKTAGTYTITIKDANNCSLETTITLSEPPPLLATLSTSSVSCFGGNNGSIAASVIGGTPPYLFNWPAINATSPNVGGLSVGSYTVLITDFLGCITNAVENITQPTVLTVTINAVDKTCSYLNNGSATAILTGGTAPYNYLWQPGNLTTASISGLNTGTYSLTATDNNGCVVLGFTTISSPLPLTANFINQTNVSCFGGSNGSVTVNAQGGTSPYTYQWFPGGTTTITYTNLQAANYSVIVTDANGCQELNNLNITQPSAAVTLSVTSTAAACFAASDGSATAQGIGGTPPYSYLWLPNNFNGATLNNIAAGTYSVTVTDANGCAAQNNSVVVNQPNQIFVNTTTINSNCGLDNGTASATVTGGIAPFTYAWSPGGNTNATATGLLSDHYNVLVIDSTGCSATQFANVNDNTGPTVNIISTTNVSCFGGVDGTATALVSSGSAPFDYNWLPAGGNGPTATGLSAGIYTLVVTDTNGCQSLATTSPPITQPTPIVSLPSSTDVSCFGGDNGTASVLVSGGTGGYTYQWLPGGNTGSSITNLFATTYTLNIRDDNNCLLTETLTINQPDAVVGSVSSITPVGCFGASTGSAAISVNGGTPNYNYSWSPQGGNGPSAIGLSAGLYSVNITDNNGCAGSVNLSITQPSQPLTVSVTSTPALCNGSADASLSAFANGGTPNYNYQWLPTGGNSQTATNLTAGTYFLIVTDTNNCQSNTIINVNEPSAINISFSSTQATCGLNNGNVISQVSGGTAPYQYLWLPGGNTSANVSNIGPGTYTLVVTDIQNCIKTQAVTLNNIAGPQVNLGLQNNVSCFGGNNGLASVQVSQGTPPYTINWLPFGGNNLLANNLSAGTYTAIATDANGCRAGVSVTINEPSPLLVNTSSITNVSCNGGNNGSITVNASGGISGYTYSWSPIISNQPSINNLQEGTYVVTAFDQNSCQTSVSINISQPSTLSSAVSNVTNPTCFGGNGSATIAGVGGTPPYSYIWGTVPVQFGASNNIITAGVTSFTVTDAQGCSFSNTVSLTQPSQVITVAGTGPTICPGQVATLTANANGGINGAYSYSWQPIGAITSGNIVVSPTSTTTFSVSAIDQNGCVGTAATITCTVFSLTPAQVNLNGNTPICPGQSSIISLNTSGNTGTLTYNWNNGLGNTAGPFVVVPSSPTTYSVEVTNQCGASVSTSLLIAFNPPPTVLLNSNINTFCIPQYVQFTDNSLTGNVTDPINSWLWNFGDGSFSIQQNPNHLYTQAGTYTITLTVTTGNGCSNTSTTTSIIINANPSPQAAFSVNSYNLNLPYDQLICTNQSQNAITYSWSFGDGGSSTATDPQYLYQSVGSFQVMLIGTSANGCKDTSLVQINTDADVTFPNVFTPNSDGSSGGYYNINALDNDIFFPYTTGVEEYKLSIFNRWGELIFETDDIKQGWDGYYKGKLCENGVYIWKADIKLLNGKTFKKNGDVTLLR